MKTTHPFIQSSIATLTVTFYKLSLNTGHSLFVINHSSKFNNQLFSLNLEMTQIPLFLLMFTLTIP